MSRRAVRPESFEPLATITLVEPDLTDTDLSTMAGNVFLPAAATGPPRHSVVNVTTVVTLNEADLAEESGDAPLALRREIGRGRRTSLDLSFPASMGAGRHGWLLDRRAPGTSGLFAPRPMPGTDRVDSVNSRTSATRSLPGGPRRLSKPTDPTYLDGSDEFDSRRLHLVWTVVVGGWDLSATGTAPSASWLSSTLPMSWWRSGFPEPALRCLREVWPLATRPRPATSTSWSC